MGKSESRVCIVISSPSRGSVRRILKRMNGKKFRWVYFGEDVSKAVSIDGIIRDKGHRFEIAGLLQEAARSLRQPYIDYIGKLSRKKNSLCWWASSLSEKSPFNSKTFLHACYIRICTEILKKYPEESFVFFVEKGAVRRALLKNIPAGNLEHIADVGGSIREALKDLKELILHKGWFSLSSIYRIAVAKYAYRMQRRVGSQRSPVLIHTWADKRSFDERGAYRDSYFGKLPEHLKRDSKNVVIVPHILSTVPYWEIVDKMAKSDWVFLIPHAFLSILDVGKVFFSALINKPKKTSYPKFENIEISELIYEDMKNDWIGARVAFDMLLYHFVRRLKEKHISIDTVIYPYENQIWEKVLCAAMREFYPSPYLIGYQHSAISMMYLHYFFSKYEPSIVPLPDRIVTNGKYTKDAFIKSGYPKERVVQGGAVRYTYLLESKKRERPRKKNKPAILVTPSISEFEAKELIWKVFKAFGQRGEYKILIKCHPDMPFDKISRHLNIKLPEHFTVSDRPVAELLRGSDVLLYTCSTTCVEAIAAGIPVVHVESDLSIDLDQLDFNPRIRPSACSPEEIVKCVEGAIRMSEEELSKKREMWSRVVRDLFSSVDDSVYRLFSR